MMQSGACELCTIIKGALPLGQASASVWVGLQCLGCLSSRRPVAQNSQDRSAYVLNVTSNSQGSPAPTSAGAVLSSLQQAVNGQSVGCGTQSSLHMNSRDPCSSRGFAFSSAAFHGQAAEDNGSDDDSRPAEQHIISSEHSNTHHHAGMKHSQQHQHQQHQRNHNHNHNHNHHAHKQQQHYAPKHTPATGQLHAAQGRRQVTSSSSPPDPLSQQLLSCKGLGVLRRVMLKYKANMGPEQVANTLLTLQHLVLQARQQGGRPRHSMQDPLDAGYQEEQLSQLFAARGQPRVRAAQSLGPATTRVKERDGPMEQLTSQVLGELGNMIWHYLGDMSGPELAKLLYSWAKIDWHPETQLLADVTASFHAALAAGQQDQQKVSSHVRHGSHEPWVAAGLWGLCKIEQPLATSSLQLLLQQWHRSLHLWTPQQLVDIAWALTPTGDVQEPADKTDSDSAGAEVVSPMQLQLIVLGLAERLVKVAFQVPGVPAAPTAATVWPESLLHAASTSPAVSSQQQSQAGLSVRPSMPQLAWGMLQALPAVGVNVNEPTSARVADLVAALGRAMQHQGRGW